MPITPPPPIPGQITPNGTAPYTQQYNFGQAMGNVLSWNPSCSETQIQNFLNDAVREYVGRRLWYGNLTRGQLVSPGYYQQGSIACTLGSNQIVGTGTGWTASLNNTPITSQSLRVGYTAPIYNILALNPITQTITIDQPWGNPSLTSTGYFITQYYYSFPNIKFFYSMKNLQLMYRMATNYAQSFIENVDPARLILMYPRGVFTMPPDPSGNYQVELWPASNVQQAYPWLGYVQPPNLVNDLDNFPPYMRTDAIVSYATSQALLWRPKDNPNYSEAMAMQLSDRKHKEFEMRISTAAQEDENLWRQDIQLREEMQLPLCDPYTGNFIAGGATLAAMTASSSDCGAWE
jgi:hypothetical protein